MSDGPENFQDVLGQELGAIKKSRGKRLKEKDTQKIGNGESARALHSPRKRGAGNDRREDPERRAFREQLIGLSFSGGGIRSATFNLGVLQGLAKFDFLRRVDYLSTVSGGGYIGAWLAAWIHWKGHKEPLRELQPVPELRPNQESRQAQSGNARGEPQEIRWLRRFSNYLTPRLGLTSGDTWALVSSYLRNVLLNQTILVSVLVALLLAALVPVAAFRAAVTGAHDSLKWWALGCLLLALTTILANVSAVMKSDQPGRWEAPVSFAAGSRGVLLLVILPLLVGAWLLWAWWQGPHDRMDDGPAAFWGGAAFTGLWVAAWGFGLLLKRLFPAKEAKGPGQAGFKSIQEGLSRFAWIVATAAIAGAFGGWLMARLGKIVEYVLQEPGAGSAVWIHLFSLSYVTSSAMADHPWHAQLWGFPFVVVIFALTETVHIGLAGERFSEAAREWWARLGGLLLLFTVTWSGLTFLALDAPYVVKTLLRMPALQPAEGWLKWGLASLWAAITGTGILAGKSPKTGNGGSSAWLEIAVKIAPPVFIIGLLLLLSMGMHEYVPGLLASGQAQAAENGTAYWRNAEYISYHAVPLALLAFGLALLAFGLALLLSWRLGINEFSMHPFYRNRLVRCYLGASRSEERVAQAFTGFDPNDDFPLASLLEESTPPRAQAVREAAGIMAALKVRLEDFFTRDVQKKSKTYPGPYPIFNTALNLVAGEELGWQKRKAASFVMTPQNCGYEFVRANGKRVSAFQPTNKGPISVGLAVATSGAAASPNMGYHSSPPLAFLMTFFNVRLGWWLGNPLKERYWQTRRPWSGLYYLLLELMGATDYQRGFVYLSDGGHFENLGLYELVRRRCRYIVVCDAAEDHDMKFGDLGNAIEKCRTDFGVDIEINIEPLRRDKETGKSRWHCAVGKIHYENANPELSSGTIVYLKSSLTGDEPTDVQRYAAEHPVFPHQSTADQFFDESQFESYRMLGQHVAESVLGAVGEEKPFEKQGDVQRFFVLLGQRWYPPSAAVATSFTRHTATYTRLLETMRKNPHLAFLDQQVYPEWTQLMLAKPEAEPSSRRASGGETTLWLPPEERDRREGFYFCNQVI